MMKLAINDILDYLKDKNVYHLTTEEVTRLLDQYTIEKEYETGIAGPIKILQIEIEDERLVLETDQKRNNYIRTIKSQDVNEFVTERLSIYDKMWDGCGCKVFYDEEWFPANKIKSVEIK